MSILIDYQEGNYGIQFGSFFVFVFVLFFVFLVFLWGGGFNAAASNSLNSSPYKGHQQC